MTKLGQKINFEPIEHKYFTESGKRLISVTQLLNLYKKPFDEDGSILKRCAQKRGITENELKKEWDKAKTDGCNYGTSVHKSIEYFITRKKIAKDGNEDIVRQLKKIRFKGLLLPEVIIGDEELGIAGTSDLLDKYNSGSIDIYDAKTNKKLSNYCPFGNKMLYPVDHLYQTDINIYSLQLSLYAYILERKLGFWINNLTLLWVNPQNRIIEIIPVPNRQMEVENIIKHYQENYLHKL